MKPTTSHNRLLELDALRGLAALGVVVFHFTTWYNNKFHIQMHPPFFFPIGYCGVHLFFMISGFVIFMTLEKTRRPQDFLLSRFSRLYPAYWMVLLINVFLVTNPDMRQFLLNATMLEAWFNSPYVVPAFWTLTTELSFYGIMLVLFMTKTLKYIESLGLLWVSIIVLNVRLAPFVHIHWPYLLEKSLLLYYGHLFVAGIIFYKIKKQGPNLARHIMLALCWIAQFFVAREFFPSPVMVGLFFAVFYLFCLDKLKVLRHPWLAFFGSISYSLYLIHENLGVKVLLFFDERRTPYMIGFTAALAVSILAAYLLTILIEQPALKFLRRKKTHNQSSENREAPAVNS